MFSSTAPILRWSSPEGRGLRRMGRLLNDAFTSACKDENLKLSVNCYIVRLFTTNSTTMTEQDKITIFDALIKPFLRDEGLFQIRWCGRGGRRDQWGLFCAM